MKVAIYIRVSTDHDEQKTSLKHQREQAIQYISSKGWDVYEFYEDIQSGTTAKRKELQRLIRDAKSKNFDVILTKEFSRLARSVSLAYQIKEIAQNNRIHIVTMDGVVNTYENGNTGHMFGIYTSMYEMEAQNTSNRVKGYRRAVAQKGLFKGSIPPCRRQVEFYTFCSFPFYTSAEKMLFRFFIRWLSSFSPPCMTSTR
ncbi:recombinase family protein [Bacillus sp. Marseille-Q1617]|uniref:recombinase family protein n=1 Tax=Bacillus sp. Marseille-Q1617 TaxID=2736887 RepID=UPI00158B09C6|nr:recombinase family protein [Bacillus sp. Marseille-Q1617]